MSAMRARPLLLLLAILLASAGCRSEGASEARSGADAGAPPRLTLEQLAIGALYVADATSRSDRPLDLRARGETLARDVWRRPDGFLPWVTDRPGPEGGLEVRVAFLYALARDGELLLTSKEPGTAFAAVQVEASRKTHDGTRERFQAQAKAEQAFEPGEQELEGVLGGLLRKAMIDARTDIEHAVRASYATDTELVRLLESGTSPGLDRAVAEAAERRLQSAVEPLIRLLESENDGLAASAATALGAIGDARAIKPIAGLTSRNDPDVLKAAVGAMAGIGGPEARRYLETIAESHASSAVREQARSLLQ